VRGAARQHRGFLTRQLTTCRSWPPCSPWRIPPAPCRPARAKTSLGHSGNLSCQLSNTTARRQIASTGQPGLALAFALFGQRPTRCQHWRQQGFTAAPRQPRLAQGRRITRQTAAGARDETIVPLPNTKVTPPASHLSGLAGIFLSIRSAAGGDIARAACPLAFIETG
jgi:hypothetical protein